MSGGCPASLEMEKALCVFLPSVSPSSAPPCRRRASPVADVLQVWLDVAAHPACGAVQAEEIRRRALAPIFNNKAR